MAQEKLARAGFATTAHVIGTLAIDVADKDKLCESILLEHSKALAAAQGGPGTPATAECAAKVKSEAPTPAAERDNSPVIAKMPGALLLTVMRLLVLEPPLPRRPL